MQTIRYVELTSAVDSTSDQLASAEPPLTVEAWLDTWLTIIVPRRVRARTLESYRGPVQRHVIPVIGHIPLVALRPEDIETLLLKLVRSGLAPATQLRIHNIVSRALKVAVQRGHVDRNVATLVDPPALVRRETSLPLTRDEVRAVLAVAHGAPNGARWTVGLALGLRQSEVLALQWRDVDLAVGQLRVSRGLHRVAGQGLVYEEPKTPRSRRTLVLPKQLTEELVGHRDQQQRRARLDGRVWSPQDLVFAHPTGAPLDRRADHRAWVALLAKAGVRRVRLHDARHTAATLLLEQGVPTRVVSELLGHSQTRITSDTYQHVLPGLAAEAAAQMQHVLFEEEMP